MTYSCTQCQHLQFYPQLSTRWLHSILDPPPPELRNFCGLRIRLHQIHTPHSRIRPSRGLLVDFLCGLQFWLPQFRTLRKIQLCARSIPCCLYISGCKPGYAGTTMCTQCPVNTYSPGHMTQCTPCGQDLLETEGPGATSAADCSKLHDIHLTSTKTF